LTTLSVVIPALNEEHSIGDTARRAAGVDRTRLGAAGIDALEIVVVDDGSTDRTADEVRALGDGAVVLVSHPENRGYGAALKTGFAAAHGDIVGFLDADGTCAPEVLPDLVRPLTRGDADIVVGMRLTPESKMPVVRRIGNRFFAWLLQFLSGVRVTDSASGMRVFTRHALDVLMPLPDGLHFTPAMSAKAVHEGLRIFEIPIPYAERAGRSKLSVVKDGFRFLNIILNTVLFYNPIKIFGWIAAFFLFIAALLVAAPVIDLVRGADVPENHYIYRTIGALYFGVGAVQVFAFGLLATCVVATFLERRGRELPFARRLTERRFGFKLALGGATLLVLGIAVNVPFAIQHFFGDGITVHWKYFVVGAAFILAGVELITASLLVRLIGDVKSYAGAPKCVSSEHGFHPSTKPNGNLDGADR
jgi:glycosyltransferase involved in cell wall biosynthesis